MEKEILFINGPFNFHFTKHSNLIYISIQGYLISLTIQSIVFSVEKKKKERKETNPSLNLPFSTVENTRDTRYQEYSSSFSLREVEGRNVKAVFTLSFVEEFRGRVLAMVIKWKLGPFQIAPRSISIHRMATYSTRFLPPKEDEALR